MQWLGTILLVPVCAMGRSAVRHRVTIGDHGHNAYYKYKQDGHRPSKALTAGEKETVPTRRREDPSETSHFSTGQGISDDRNVLLCFPCYWIYENRGHWPSDRRIAVYTVWGERMCSFLMTSVYPALHRKYNRATCVWWGLIGILFNLDDVFSPLLYYFVVIGSGYHFYVTFTSVGVYWGFSTEILMCLYITMWCLALNWYSNRCDFF